MEPEKISTSTSEINKPIQETEPVYHTISGGTETLAEKQRSKSIVTSEQLHVPVAVTDTVLDKEVVTVNTNLRSENIIIRYVYAIFVSFILFFILLSFLKNNTYLNQNFFTYILWLYYSLAFFLFVFSVKSILQKKSYYMLGQFFLFLISPVLIGFGLCMTFMYGISIFSAFKN
ncbi:MAG: hypothetical protein KBC41_00395 [Candidatus Pacebacteria bacterium]|nr:hypothetical protein [Candidatus Paceibacterota bacterium]MBP9866525.1 hypothetical protein [Candidatus Paceibacterota bacterium]